MPYAELTKPATQSAFHEEVRNGLQLQLATGPQRIGHVGGSKPWSFQGSFGGLLEIEKICVPSRFHKNDG